MKNEFGKVTYLREFRIRGIRCVSVKIDEILLGFYVGTDDDWSDGIITKRDLKTIDQLKNEINSNVEN